MPEEPRWYRVADFGRTFGYSPAAVRRMLRSGAVTSRTAPDGSPEICQPAIVGLADLAADSVPRLGRKVVADLLGVSPRRVDQLVEEGRLERHQVGRTYRYSVNAVFDYLAGRANTRTAGLQRQMLAWASRRLQAKIAVGPGRTTDTAQFQAEMERIATMPAPRQPVEYARLLLRYERGHRQHVAAMERREQARADMRPVAQELARPHP